MAKLKVFTVHDLKVQAYLQPFFSRTTGEALRTWETVCNDGQSMMAKHPADFQLFEVAEFDESTGRFDQLEILRPLGSALESKRQDQPSSVLRELKA